MDQSVILPLHPALVEFIAYTNGTTTIRPQANDWMWLIIRQHLDLAPEQPKPIPPEGHYIRISLLDSRIPTKIQNPSRLTPERDTIRINTLYRQHLSDRGENIIAAHIRTTFKECFHNFILGVLAHNPRASQRDTIDLFLATFHITPRTITYDMLEKSWKRSPQREMIRHRIINRKTNYCPVVT